MSNPIKWLGPVGRNYGLTQVAEAFAELNRLAAANPTLEWRLVNVIVALLATTAKPTEEGAI